ncbi:hypothetical protein JCM8097_003502 [Rhodosporidiobolus ruineniae]
METHRGGSESLKGTAGLDKQAAGLSDEAGTSKPPVTASTSNTAASPALSASSTLSPILSAASVRSSPATSVDYHAPKPPATSVTADYYAASSPGRQVGLFAARPLKRGERILCEAPLFTVNSLVDLPSAVSSLFSKSCDTFYELSNAYEDDPDTAIEAGLFFTNAFALSSSTRLTTSASPPPASSFSVPLYGIFPTSARINHSCRPNVETSYSPSLGRLVVHVLRPIPAHEELFTSYLGRSDLYGLDTAARQLRLLKNWAFACSCTLCSSSVNEREVSDARRRELGRLRLSLPGLRPSNVEKTLRDCARALDLLDADSLFLASGSDFCLPAARACAWHQDYKSARFWAELGWKSAREELGEESEVAREMEKAMRGPRGLLPSGARGEKMDLLELTRELLAKR